MKVFAVDMDGTFLDSNNAYDKKYFEKLNTEYKDEFKLIVASSNTISHLKTFFKHNDIYFIGSNGAVIAREEEIIDTQFLDTTDINRVLMYLDNKHIYSYVISILEKSYVNKAAGEQFISRMQHYYNDLIINNLNEMNDITKITIEIKGDMKELIAQLNALCQSSIAVDSGFNCIDITHKRINKAVAIKKVMNILGAKMHDLYVFGDSDNDIEMLKLTKNSFAMANGNDKVKSIAKHEIPSNDENGVLITMEKILKEEL
ncbi:Cof-type HAD-IIB family hydrolase [Macrococcoides goetzii]|uniref:Cof-type HAD-IIB family hydrolase n=1 Tax=Macrococcus sp. PK TaxID=2801919 RepID=UPI001F10E2CD|nr:Cof-type HAD-IIB family hydrolase [Macrococcus sp. PK]MCH4984769.1 HAD family hydrolase [Macrococcus sp. PK]